MNNKTILFNQVAREGLKKGIDIVANAVKVTLGYGGRTVVISEEGLPSRTTKDGVTVANSIKLSDQVLDAGAKFIQEVSSKTANDAGDGTTTVCVLMQHLVENGLRAIAEGANPVLLKRGMERALGVVVDALMGQKVNFDEKLLESVATISANNDKELGKIISDAYLKLGSHAIITVEDSKVPQTYIEITDGFQFDSGFVVHHFINNFAKNTCEMINPYVLLAEGQINDPQDIWELLNKIAVEKRPLLIVAEGFDRSVIQVLLNNRDKFTSCVVKYEFLGDTKQELMHDICAITGATPVEKKGDQLKKIGIDYLGECEKIIVADKETTLIKGRTDKELLEARIEDAKTKIDNAKNLFLKQKQEKRFARLSGCLAVCYVGGSTEVEISEKKDRIDDSIRATKAAIEEGVVPGGGTALLRCAQSLLLISNPNKDFAKGVSIVKEALEVPAQQIAENSGVDGREVVKMILKTDARYGYNAATNTIEDLFECGVVDPHKVVRSCIENSVSASGQLLISEALIITEKS